MHLEASAPEREHVDGFSSVGVELFTSANEVQDRARLELLLIGLDAEGDRLTLMGQVELLGLDAFGTFPEEGLVGNAVETAVVGHEVSDDIAATGMGIPLAMLATTGSLRETARRARIRPASRGNKNGVTSG